MQRWKNILYNIVFCLNILLLFLVIFIDYVSVPSWLQVVGRMHPLVLHFPIVLLFIYILWSAWISRLSSFKEHAAMVGDTLLLITALFAGITALMGILLSREEGYDADALFWHKWSGTLVSLVCFAWYTYSNTIRSKKFFSVSLTTVSFLLILIAGHQGAAITHGQDYLLAPILHDAAKPPVAFENAVLYTDMVKPILDAKCISCHNAKKAKGSLIMETEVQLLKGGKHGSLWNKDNPELSLLLKRVQLPVDEKRHMPPLGKPQLNEEEEQVLFQWIKSGADFKVKVSALPANDSLRILAKNQFKSGGEETYDFDAADEKKVSQLSNTNRVIHPIALESPALAVNFYNRQNYNTAALKELLPLKEQITALDLAYMPVKQEDLDIITQFNNLRTLNLNFSSLPGTGIAELQSLKKLHLISLSGTNVNEKDIAPLTKFPKLSAVYLWNTPVNAKALEALKKSNAKIHFETGFMNDTLVLKLNPPVLETDDRIINGSSLTLKLKHFIKGVNIRYTTDGSYPDSVNAALYKDSVVLTKAAIFKARAFKPGWLGSDSIAAVFFKNSVRADSIRSLTPLDSVYKGKLAAKTLINGEKGEFNFGDGRWLGFRKNKMDMVLYFKNPVTLSTVTLSTLVDIGGFIMPPISVEIWGGSSEKNLLKLATIHPQQPEKIQAAYMKGYDCVFKPVSLKCIRIVAVPVSKLPPWHPGKGQKGWIFTDEIFLN